ncbi:methyl-accepting chemotaxis protein [Pseudomonas tohonis]|uniref:methyl-accepting chemotaxis protein n=1 Tax=Pseudomonas tohonis TaxID=2725477 RepID=UPI001563959A|nr:methyl-accepting chemotaxis protein [Pseudomonas tohonis]
MSQNLYRLRTLTLRLLLEKDDRALLDDLQRIQELHQNLDKFQSAYSKTVSGQKQQTLYDAFDSAERAYLNSHTQVVELMQSQRASDAKEVVNRDMNAQANAMATALSELTHYHEQEALRASTQSGTVFNSAKMILFVCIVLTLAMVVLLAMLLTRSIVKPLGEAVDFAQQIASGDLVSQCVAYGADELSQLQEALNKMQESLRQAVHGMADSSQQLAATASELNSVTLNESKALTQQNAEIEMAATAVNQMTSAVDEVARNAVNTSEASNQSSQSAEVGRREMRRTVDAISVLATEVDETSSKISALAENIREISSVLDVIRSIADQTNLLALNAAIEAARAGEQGRGFAVVADEVRMLAQRSQQSTLEIEKMIGLIQTETEQSVRAMLNSRDSAMSTMTMAESAGQALDEITHSITQISERNLLIASATEEQASVAKEVDRSLINIRDLSMQTIAGANQASTASYQLSQLAARLNEMVGRFKI